MKTTMLPIQRYNSTVLSLACVFVLALSGCSISFLGFEYKRGEKAEDKKNYTQAITHYSKVIHREPDSELALSAANRAARIAFFETKNFLEAIEFYLHVVKYSKNDVERRSAQKNIANIYFQNLNDYSKAIDEYNKLLLLRNSTEENYEIKMNLAKAHFNLNQFSDAESEVQDALKFAAEDNKKFDANSFLASVYFNTKRVEEAIKIYERLMQEYPERARAENVEMNIIVSYEEVEAFDKAIAKLEILRERYHDPEFIDLKIRRLKERKANLPGSRGLRK